MGTNVANGQVSHVILEYPDRGLRIAGLAATPSGLYYSAVYQDPDSTITEVFANTLMGVEKYTFLAQSDCRVDAIHSRVPVAAGDDIVFVALSGVGCDPTIYFHIPSTGHTEKVLTGYDVFDIELTDNYLYFSTTDDVSLDNNSSGVLYRMSLDGVSEVEEIFGNDVCDFAVHDDTKIYYGSCDGSLYRFFYIDGRVMSRRKLFSMMRIVVRTEIHGDWMYWMSSGDMMRMMVHNESHYEAVFYDHQSDVAVPFAVTE